MVPGAKPHSHLAPRHRICHARTGSTQGAVSFSRVPCVLTCTSCPSLDLGYSEYSFFNLLGILPWGYFLLLRYFLPLTALPASIRAWKREESASLGVSFPLPFLVRSFAITRPSGNPSFCCGGILDYKPASLSVPGWYSMPEGGGNQAIHGNLDIMP